MTGLKGALFPGGAPSDDNQTRTVLFEQYKLLVETSERVVARRQTANTFFLSINSLLLVAVGVLVREAAGAAVGVLGIIGLAILGTFTCQAWRWMVLSFRQLNAAKFEIIHLMEDHLPAATFKAEWDALGRGADPSRYRPFTNTEAWMPWVFTVLHVLMAIGGIALVAADI